MAEAMEEIVLTMEAQADERLKAQCAADPNAAGAVLSAAANEAKQKDKAAKQEIEKSAIKIIQAKKGSLKAAEKATKLNVPPPPPMPWKCKLCIKSEAECGNYCKREPWSVVKKDLENTRATLKLKPGE